MAVEQKKLENFLHKAVGDLGATVAGKVSTGTCGGMGAWPTENAPPSK